MEEEEKKGEGEREGGRERGREGGTLISFMSLSSMTCRPAVSTMTVVKPSALAFSSPLRAISEGGREGEGRKEGGGVP